MHGFATWHLKPTEGTLKFAQEGVVQSSKAATALSQHLEIQLIWVWLLLQCQQGGCILSLYISFIVTHKPENNVA